MSGRSRAIIDESERSGRGILTLNAGSSSLKMALFGDGDDELILTGQVDRIGPEAVACLQGADGACLPTIDADLGSHRAAFAALIGSMQARSPGVQLQAIGHRVVHGGARFADPVLIEPVVLDQLSRLEGLAPLHQPHNLRGIRIASQAFPDVSQVACFDTAFHRQHRFASEAFALPLRYYERGVRRYGFHGISYESVMGDLARMAPELASGRVVVAHLGNGASMCAVRSGRSIATTMGFSTLDGLPMGTRCGQIDPGVLLYMLQEEQLALNRIQEILYRESGLLGLSAGLSSDMRTLEASDSPAAARAIDYFVYRARLELGAMAAALGGIDALVFCGGIGENSPRIRRLICEHQAWIGIDLDQAANQRHASVISSAGSPTTVMVIPTHEDRVIARAARRVASSALPRSEPVAASRSCQ